MYQMYQILPKTLLLLLVLLFLPLKSPLQQIVFYSCVTKLKAFFQFYTPVPCQSWWTDVDDDPVSIMVHFSMFDSLHPFH